MTGKDGKDSKDSPAKPRAEHRKPTNRTTTVAPSVREQRAMALQAKKAAAANAPKNNAGRATEAAAAPAAAPTAVDAPAAAVRKRQERKGPAPALEAVGLGKSYGDVPALAALDLLVEPGEAVVLIGHNGSGKTTFLRMASGLLDPSEGTVDVAGHIAGSLGARAACSYLADNPTFYDDLSVWEHLEYVARLHGRTDWEQDAADLLGLLGLYHRADDLPVTFSRGLRQKTAIALGLIRPFDVLLVDEPFVGLDASGKAALLELFDEHRAKGTTLVVATHELEFVHRVTRCVALRDGGLVYDGPAEGVDVLELVS
jgi:ABC-type multidrug transport system ATPase subunit